MNYFKKILLALGLLILISFGDLFAGVVDIPTLWWVDKIKDVSIDHVVWTGSIVESVNGLWFRILQILKLILQWLLVIYIVYIWITMIISMWTDEDKLSKSKNQLWYSLIALVFINIPWTIYSAIYIDNRRQWQWSINGQGEWKQFTDESTISWFVNLESFKWVLASITWFLEVFIFGVALFVLVMAGIKIMTSRWKEEKITEAKNKILYSIFAMIFVGMIEAWKQLAITGDIIKWTAIWTTIFSQLTNLALLFAGPVVIFFLTLAGYYYISSNGDEERIKKAKAIIINTIIAILLLIVMVTFLNDLITL